MSLKQRLLLHAPGLRPSAVLEKPGEIQMIDVWIPTVDQRWLILPCYTQPSPTPSCSSKSGDWSCRASRPRDSPRKQQGYEIEVEPSRSSAVYGATRLIPKRLTRSEEPNCERSDKMPENDLNEQPLTLLPLLDWAFA